MIFNILELTHNIIIIGNHDRIKLLPDLPDIALDALQLFSPEDFMNGLFHKERDAVNDGYAMPFLNQSAILISVEITLIRVRFEPFFIFIQVRSTQIDHVLHPKYRDNHIELRHFRVV